MEKLTLEQEHARKIDLINAFRALLGVRLPSRKIPDAVYEEIQSEFLAWVKGRIDELLGMKQASAGGLTSEEVARVRDLLNRFPASGSEVVMPPRPLKTAPPTAPRGMAPKRPVAPRPEPNELADALDRMEMERERELEKRRQRGEIIDE